MLRERGALQPRAALDILEPVLAALGAAHRAGFVHRDMKPENVLIGDDGRVKVADFGLVRAVDTVTNTTGAVLGTVSYLAPEQIEHGTADTRVDVYACGVVLYEMLTGAKPHAGDTPAQVLYQHLHEDVPAAVGRRARAGRRAGRAGRRRHRAQPRASARTTPWRCSAQVPRGARRARPTSSWTPCRRRRVAAAHDDAEDRTSVIPRALAVPRPLPVNEDEPPADELPTAPAGWELPAPAGARRRPLPAAARPRRGAARRRSSPSCWSSGSARVSGTSTPASSPRSRRCWRRPQTEAETRLTDAGLDVGKVERAYSDTVTARHGHQHATRSSASASGATTR